MSAVIQYVIYSHTLTLQFQICGHVCHIESRLRRRIQ